MTFYKLCMLEQLACRRTFGKPGPWANLKIQLVDHWSDVHYWFCTCTTCASQKLHHQNTSFFQLRVDIQCRSSHVISYIGPLTWYSYSLVASDYVFYFTFWVEVYPISNQEMSTYASKWTNDIFLAKSVTFQSRQIIWVYFNILKSVDYYRFRNPEPLPIIHREIDWLNTLTEPCFPLASKIIQKAGKIMQEVFVWPITLNAQLTTGFTPFYLRYDQQSYIAIGVIMAASCRKFT